MAEPILDVEAIAKSFGNFRALRELSFEAHGGEVIGLLGPNGAGKTTTIRILSTILEPSQGRFTIDGVPSTEGESIRRRIGVLPESSGYPLHWTGAEFVAYHARLFGFSRAQACEQVAGLLADVGMSDRADSLIRTYSRGMRQRLGVARALVNQPRVIFLDEPTLGLDPAGQRQMLQLIREIASQRGVAVILSTHFLDEVEEICSRILILNRGEVIADGTVDEVKRRAAPQGLRIQVEAGRGDQAADAVRRAEGVTRVERAGDDASRLDLVFDPARLERTNEGTNSAIRALVEAGISILALEREGGRLSDAFLALTEGEEVAPNGSTGRS